MIYFRLHIYGIYYHNYRSVSESVSFTASSTYLKTAPNLMSRGHNYKTTQVVAKARFPLSELPTSMNFAPKKQYEQHNISRQLVRNI